MKEPELSVILCTCNRSHLLHHILKDFEKQVFPKGVFPWELVIVDNNSTDETKDLVQYWIAKRHLPIQYIFESQQGKSYALNTGVKISKAHLLAFTDDDVVLDSHWLSSIYKAAKTYPHNCFGGKILPILQGTLPDWLNENGPSVMLGGPLVKHDRGEFVKEYDENMYVPVLANMFLRKEVFETYGFFNLDLGPGSRGGVRSGDDSEFMFRIKKAGEPILYYPEAVVYHPAPSSRLRKSYFRSYFWSSGRASARWFDVLPGTVKYFNVPRYLLRMAAGDFLRLLFSVTCSRKWKKFYNEVQLIYILGMIYEFHKNDTPCKKLNG